MSRLVLATLLAVPIGAAILYACSPFHASETETPDATADGADGDIAISRDGSVAEASTATPLDGAISEPDTAEYDLPLEDGGTLHCLNFRRGNGGFVTTGNAEISDAGFVLQLKSGSQNSIMGTFSAGTTIRASTVRIDERVETVGDFTANHFADGIAQYFGAVPGAATVPRTALEYAPAEVELNVWPRSDDKDKSFFAFSDEELPLKNVDGFVWVDTTWADAGSISFAADGKPVEASSSFNMAGVPSTALSLVIGGGSNDQSNPNVTIRVRSICVGFR